MSKKEILVKYRKSPKGVLTNMYQHHKARTKKYGYGLTYSLKELHDRFLNDKKFLEIYKKWADGGYHYYDKPSVDRINANRGYSLDNIQILSWLDNRKKGDIEVAKKKHKRIIQYDKYGNPIQTFSSIKEAVNTTNVSQGNISSVLVGKRSRAGGFKWKYA